MFSLLIESGDFPGDPVVKNRPCNAELRRSIPGQGTRIPYAAEQLTPRTTTAEPTPQSLRATARELTCQLLKHTPPGAHLPQLESPGTATKDLA